MLKKTIWLLTTALAGSLFATTGAMAQSTGSLAVEEIVVTASALPQSLDGVMVGEAAPRSRSTITSEFLETQPVGQSVLQSLNLTPGLNFTNNDPYGSSGGNIRLRGFDGSRVSLTWDGTPLNDSGNYAVYTNQLADPEVIDRISVNQGTTDVDSPTPSASGGTINVVTRRPLSEGGLTFNTAVGSNDYKRLFAMVDTGEIGPFGTSAFLAASYQNYQKFKGPGDLTKLQMNGRIYQPLGGEDFVSLAFHYNRNRNYNYRTVTLADFNRFGRRYDYDETCPTATGTPGVADADNFCTNFWGRQTNPSNTGNIRGSSAFTLTDKLRLTVDPSFQYTLATGGSQLNSFATDVQRETDGRLRGRSTAAGVDLNGDGDILDTVRFQAPGVTNTRRYAVTTSLIYDLNEDHRFRAAYTFDRAKHRQTGDYGYLDSRGFPVDTFGGKDGAGTKVLAADGASIRVRDRYSVAKLSQFAFEYRGEFFEDRLVASLGVRAPRFTRELNQFCFTQDGTSSVRCTTEAPAATLANGNVTFAGVGSPTPTQYIPPFALTRKYDKVLPNLGFTFEIAEGQSIYGSFAKGISLPRTDNLYTVKRQADGSIAAPNAVPETTNAWDIGYRLQRGPFLGSVAAWKIDFKNRIVSAFDDDLGVFIDRNVGDVKQWGVDAQIGFQPVDALTLYGTASYNNSEVQSDVRVGVATTAILPAKGKKLVETPEWTIGGRVEWEPTAFIHVGLQGKWVDDRFATDVNDEVAPGYTVFDADLRVDLPVFGGMESAYLQFNVSNLFDETYLGSISTRSNAVTIPGVQTGSAPTYNIGSPRTYQVSLGTRF
jgi:iron complex outermembrane receptor protein